MELPCLYGLMFLPNTADGTATYVTADMFIVVADEKATFVTG